MVYITYTISCSGRYALLNEYLAWSKEHLKAFGSNKIKSKVSRGV